jgi:hypothetical protein
MAERPHPDRPGHRDPRAHASDQVFHYPLAREYVEPDWRRIPGYRDVTTEQWESAQWQRAHTVKNLRVQARAWRLPRRRAEPGHPAGPAGASHDVHAHPAADDQHDGRGGPACGQGPHVHGAGVLRPSRRVDQPPHGVKGLAARGGHVGGRGSHPPLPHQGARGAAVHLPPVLRTLHAHGPGRERHAAVPEVQVRGQAAGTLGGHARVPAPDAVGSRRGGVGR